ncbi:hypothetical protein FRE64_17190 (plasmid) [Euhalothece natronophila Z-M001]|uniref:Uncharacterized protein n=1 Tax=Euhalothece natronophila Z-M001 TaxID=522448 RepID=A0A5B8NRP4_9CHRO|nr:hypothetical protein [Euhalothece natronophila]QDZ41698.1 hypothetical protein FRE64_17190 [Euhalothece natronophila Z-M001]
MKPNSGSLMNPKKETKIHLQLAQNNQISLEYNLHLGEFHHLYSKLPEELKLKLNNQLKKKNQSHHSKKKNNQSNQQQKN